MVAKGTKAWADTPDDWVDDLRGGAEQIVPSDYLNSHQQEPVAFRNINTGEFCTGGFLRKDWAKWQPLYAAPVHASENAKKQEPVGYLYDWLNPENRDEVIRDWFAASMYVIEKDKGFNVRPLYTAPVHASENAEKQEPVAWIKESEIAGMSASAGLGIFEWKTNLGLKPEPGDVPLYTAPREWVGLTDHELQVLDFNDPERGKLARAVEAKLKEKNHG
jgi:hypothetical protein